MGEQDRPLWTPHHRETSRHEQKASRLTARSTYELIREAAAHDAERTAIAFFSGGGPQERPAGLSYGALLNGLHQTANLLADLGVGAQEVIALLLPELPETHWLFWGGQVSGIVCPVHPGLSFEQTVALLRATKARLLVAAGPELNRDLWQKAEAVRGEVKSLTGLLQVRGPGEERRAVYAFDALLSDYPSDGLQTGRDIAPNDLAVYLPTTLAGTPGLLPLTHAHLLDAARALSNVLTLTPEEVLLHGLARFLQGWQPGVTQTSPGLTSGTTPV